MSLSLQSRQASNSIRRAFASTSQAAGPSIRHKTRDAATSFAVRKPRFGLRENERLEPARKTEEKDQIAFPYEPREVPHNVRHPSYHQDEVMSFTDSAARFPPVEAVKRNARLAHARSLGIHHNNLNKTLEKRLITPPDVPVSLSRDRPERVAYQMGKSGETKERRAYFDNSEVESIELESMDWNNAEMGEIIPGLEAGRIVECRR